MLISHLGFGAGGSEEEAAESTEAVVSLPEGQREEHLSVRGRVLGDLISYVSNDLAIGKQLKTGELRKRMQEPEWTVPEVFNLTSISLEHFQMKLLSRKENPRTDFVILQLHGGGYMGAIRNAYYVFAGLYNEVSKGMNVLTPDYRVAPEHPYPAALEDAASAYEWLLGRGYSGRQIILGGDSAGGGLAMALTMYLRDHFEEFRGRAQEKYGEHFGEDLSVRDLLPRGIVAMSPWTDLTASGESYEANFDKDPLYGGTRESLIYQNDYPGDADARDPYISPAFGDFADFPPMLLQVGSLEMLLSDSKTVAEKARAAGVKVRLNVYEGMFHDFQMAYLMLPESKHAWSEVGRFLEILTRGE